MKQSRPGAIPVSTSRHLVQMVRNSVEPGGRDLFSCSTDAWMLLVEIGTAFGWKALGASYVVRDIAQQKDSPARHGYQPGDARDGKLVIAADAFAWAKALTEARESPHLAAMIGDRPMVPVPHRAATADEVRSANAPFITIMDEFIAYAFSGEFEFFHS